MRSVPNSARAGASSKSAMSPSTNRTSNAPCWLIVDTVCASGLVPYAVKKTSFGAFVPANGTPANCAVP